VCYVAAGTWEDGQGGQAVERDSYEPGTPSWVDLGSSDLGKSVPFYGNLFGWDIEEGPPEAGGYRMCLLKGRPVAGLGPAQRAGPSFWSTYINVPSADEAASKVKDNGGQVFMEPFDVMEFGRMAVFADPTGAVISVWQPGQMIGAGLVDEPGAFTWTELITSDVGAASKFYAAVFGWEAGGHGSGAGGYHEFRLGGNMIAGMRPKPPQMPAEVPSFWSVYFEVGDTDAAVARTRQLGGSLLMGPRDLDVGRMAAVADPNGTPFNVIAMKSRDG
jgi:uncharacterized protein